MTGISPARRVLAQGIAPAVLDEGVLMHRTTVGFDHGAALDDEVDLADMRHVRMISDLALPPDGGPRSTDGAASRAPQTVGAVT